MYLSNEFKKAIDAYLAPLSAEEKETYYRQGEESIAVREQEGLTPETYRNLIKGIGDYLEDTSGKNFISEYQRIAITDAIVFYSFQLSGGGNFNVFTTPEGKMVIDTGYGTYHEDIEKMLKVLGLGGYEDIKSVVCTHGDADHCGASGYYPVPPVMHPVTKALLDSGTRAYGSHCPKPLLEQFYTTTINTMSRMHVPKDVIETATEPIGNRGLFPIIGHVSFAGMDFEIWESLGGHIAGQLLLYEPKFGLLFTSDAFINFATLSKERADYCSVADSMIGSVNVDSAIARTERQELARLFAELDQELHMHGRRLLICCGHGAVSIVDGDHLAPASELLKYTVS